MKFSFVVPFGVERSARQIARLLPRRVKPLTGPVYSIFLVRREGRDSQWKAAREWIL